METIFRTRYVSVVAVVFGAVGTSGQRCTTTRRLIVQKGVKDDVITRLVKQPPAETAVEPWPWAKVKSRAR